MRFVFGLICCFAFALSALPNQKNPPRRSLAPLTSVRLTAKLSIRKKLKGKIVVLNLWFVGCPNCVEEIKLLNSLVDEYKNKDVIFIGLATNDKAKLESFLIKNPFKYHIVPKAMPTILSFGEPDKNGEINIPFPMHVVVDRNGKIVVRRSGIKGLDAVKAELKKQLENAPVKTE